MFFTIACSDLPTRRIVKKWLDSPIPPSEKIYGEPLATIDRWEMASDDLPLTIGNRPYLGDNPTARVAVQLLEEQGLGHKLSDGATCYARETARFWLRHRGNIPDDIDRFIRARCAVPTTRTRTIYQYSNLNPGDDANKLLTNIEQIKENLAQKSRRSIIGLWGESDSSTAVIVTVIGTPDLTITPTRMTSMDGETATFTVTELKPLSILEGYSTSGPLGYDTCEVLKKGSHRRRADYTFSCPIDKKSYYTLIELVSSKKGNILSSVTFSSMFAVKPEYLLSQYDSGRSTQPNTAERSDLDTRTYLEQINKLRKQQHLITLSLERDQSITISRLLPHLLAATNAGEESNADEIALSMMAGWDVPELTGIIQGANFSDTSSHSSWPFARMFDASLMSPAYRAIAFDPEIRTISVGLINDEDYMTRSIAIVGHSYFNKQSYYEDEITIFDLLNNHRKAIGSPAIEPIKDPDLLRLIRNTTLSLRNGESSPELTLRELPLQMELLTGIKFSAEIILSSTLDPWMIDFPEELLLTDWPVAAVLVTHHKPRNLPWGQYVVMFIYGEERILW